MPQGHIFQSTQILFVIASIWKQSRCPTMEEWMQNMWFIFTTEYYSAIKEDIHHEFYRQMDGNETFHQD